MQNQNATGFFLSPSDGHKESLNSLGDLGCNSTICNSWDPASVRELSSDLLLILGFARSIRPVGPLWKDKIEENVDYHTCSSCLKVRRSIIA